MKKTEEIVSRMRSTTIIIIIWRERREEETSMPAFLECLHTQMSERFHYTRLKVCCGIIALFPVARRTQENCHSESMFNGAFQEFTQISIERVFHENRSDSLNKKCKRVERRKVYKSKATFKNLLQLSSRRWLEMLSSHGLVTFKCFNFAFFCGIIDQSFRCCFIQARLLIPKTKRISPLLRIKIIYSFRFHQSQKSFRNSENCSGVM